MHILFLSWWWAYPADNGAKIRIYNLLRKLTKVFTVTLLSFGEPMEISAEQLEHMRSICHHVEVIPRPHDAPGTLQTLQGYLSPWPRSLVYNYSAEMDEQVRKIIQTENIDVIVASQIDMMRYLELAAGIPAILEEAEVTSFYNRIQETHGSARLRAQLTLDKLAHALHIITEHGASVTVVSETERAYIQNFAPDNARIEVIPNGVDTTIFHPNGITPEPYTLIYPGAVTYSANYDAVSYFIQEVMPLVRERIPQAQFTVTGDTGSVDVSHLANQPGVVFSGYLESVTATIQRSWATVVPLRQGGGTRLKILESMALGTPVISTQKGAEGLNIHTGQDILIADTPEEMADAIYRVFESSQLRASLAAKGRALVEGEYDWTIISSKLLNLIEEVGGKGA